MDGRRRVLVLASIRRGQICFASLWTRRALHPDVSQQRNVAISRQSDVLLVKVSFKRDDGKDKPDFLSRVPIFIHWRRTQKRLNLSIVDRPVGKG